MQSCATKDSNGEHRRSILTASHQFNLIVETALTVLGNSWLKRVARTIHVESMNLKKKLLRSVNYEGGSSDEAILPPPNLHNVSSDRNLFTIFQEYCKLSKVINPSEQDLDRLEAILELSQYDAELSGLINEADHLVIYELELSGSDKLAPRFTET
jgi:hypothetical protein